MKKPILAMVAFLSTSSAFAASYGTGTVAGYNIDSDGWAEFGTTVALPSTCSYFGNQFRFDANTTKGKNMLLTLLAAKATGLTIRVWYNESTAPGTNQSNGCNGTTMAAITSIGLQ